MGGRRAIRDPWFWEVVIHIEIVIVVSRVPVSEVINEVAAVPSNVVVGIWDQMILLVNGAAEGARLVGATVGTREGLVEGAAV